MSYRDDISALNMRQNPIPVSKETIIYSTLEGEYIMINQERLQIAVREALEQDIDGPGMEVVPISFERAISRLPFTKQLLDHLLAGEPV